MGQKIDSVLDKIETISEDLTEVRIKLGRIEEHLSTLNGTVARHEQNIHSNECNIEEGKIQLAKITAIGGLGGGLVGAVLFILAKVFGI